MATAAGNGRVTPRSRTCQFDPFKVEIAGSNPAGVTTRNQILTRIRSYASGLLVTDLVTI
jgi:hypothetical protein